MLRKLAASALRQRLGIQQLLHTSGLPADQAQQSLGPAFCFDIDGVLIRGSSVLPEAKQALAKLYEPGGEVPKHPVCFLTNGGGVTEAQKAEQLSQWLDVAVAEHQVVLSHTPFRELAQQFGDSPVLIAGRGATPQVAASYGFRKAVTTTQLEHQYPHALPFKESTEETSSSIPDASWGTERDPFRAIFVFTDPSDWYRDMQLLTDCTMGAAGGVMGRSSAAPDSPPVQLYFSQQDTTYSNEFPAPRFAQGIFIEALTSAYKAITGKPLPHHKVFGKPHPEPYELVGKLLLRQAQQRAGLPDGAAAANGMQRLPFSAVYAVGDNPASDIRGARNAGRPWTSILVRTGVFSGGCNDPRDPADLVVDHVLHAVQAALHRHRYDRWHSLR